MRSPVKEERRCKDWALGHSSFMRSRRGQASKGEQEGTTREEAGKPGAWRGLRMEARVSARTSGPVAVATQAGLERRMQGGSGDRDCRQLSGALLQKGAEFEVVSGGVNKLGRIIFQLEALSACLDADGSDSVESEILIVWDGGLLKTLLE